MYDMYKHDNCGCFERPEHDHRKDRDCDFDSTFLGNGLVRQRETIRTTATSSPRFVFLSDGNGNTNVKVKIKNLSTNPIIVTTNFGQTTVGPNGELLISAFALTGIQVETTAADATANVLLCFELLVCTPCHVASGGLCNGGLTNDVNTDSQEENI